MTVRVRFRLVSADRRSFNVEMCRDIDNITSSGRSRRGSPKAGTTVIPQLQPPSKPPWSGRKRGGGSFTRGLIIL